MPTGRADAVEPPERPSSPDAPTGSQSRHLDTRSRPRPVAPTARSELSGQNTGQALQPRHKVTGERQAEAPAGRGTGRQGKAGRGWPEEAPDGQNAPWSHKDYPPSSPDGPQAQILAVQPGPAHRRPGAGASLDVRARAVFSAAQNVAQSAGLAVKISP